MIVGPGSSADGGPKADRPVQRHPQAGAGSAINDTVREVGGALGIAVVGSIVAAIYSHRLSALLTSNHAPGSVARAATSSIAQADGIAKQVGGPVGSQLASAAHLAFTTGMSAGMQVAAAVAIAGAVLCFVTLPRRFAQAREDNYPTEVSLAEPARCRATVVLELAP